MFIPDNNHTTNMSMTNSTGEVSDDVLMNIISISVWVVTTLLILVMNSLCLVLLARVKGFSKATIVFLRSMTIADLFLGVFFYLPTIAVFINDREWPFGDVFCYIQAWVIRTVLPTSGINVLLVTIDRYIAIVYPMKYEVLLSAKRARLVICCVWIVTNLYGLLTSLIENWTSSFSEHYFICTIGPFNNSKAVVTLTLMSIGTFIIIMAMYVRILVIARRHATHMATHRPSLTSVGSTEDPPAPSPNRKSFVTVFIITIALLIGWMPSVILGFADVDSPSVPLVIATQIPLASVSWLNVIVYYIRNHAFQEAAHELYLHIVQYCKGCCKK